MNGPLVPTYGVIITMVFFMVFLSLVSLTVMLRPRPFFHVVRGGEAAVCFGLAGFTGCLLLLIANGLHPPYPLDTPIPDTRVVIRGDVWAVLIIVLLGVSAAFPFFRIGQILRHRERERDSKQRLQAYVSEREKKL